LGLALAFNPIILSKNYNEHIYTLSFVLASDSPPEQATPHMLSVLVLNNLIAPLSRRNKELRLEALGVHRTRWGQRPVSMAKDQEEDMEEDHKRDKE
jgi:hypothetical protein